MALAWQTGIAADRPSRKAWRGRSVAARAEPVFALPGAAAGELTRPALDVAPLGDADQPLPHRPGSEPEARAASPRVAGSGFRKASIALSCLLHMAVAAAFLQAATEDVLIAGGAQADAAMLGNAPDDQLATGDDTAPSEPDATRVTIVTLFSASPVETVDATVVPVDGEATAVETIDPVDLPEDVALAPTESETVEQAPCDVAPDVTLASAVEPIRPDPALPEAPATAQAVPSTAPESAPQAAAVPALEILAAARLDPVSAESVAPLAAVMPDPALAPVPEATPVLEAPPIQPEQPVTTTQAQPVTDEALAPSVEDPAQLTPVDTPLALAKVDEAVQPSEILVAPIAPIAPAAALKPVKDPPPVAKTEPTRNPTKKKPEPKVVKEVPAKPKPAKAKPELAKAKTGTETKADAAARKTKAKAGSKGKNQADARRGDADGSATGRSAARGKGAKESTAAGNAAVSNYPGKIVSKLRRALRYPPGAKRAGLRGEVQVSFTVTASGGVGSVRVVRSSGSPILDKAALDTVRRAAPFPAIPQGAGRSSWPFTVPLAFAR